MRQPAQIHALVNQQVRRWDLERRAREGGAERHWPSITVSRQYGAHGAELGRLLADRLSFHFWDREILHEIAGHSEVQESLLASVDEHRRSAIADIVAGLGSGPHLSAGGYRMALLRVVRTIGEHGRAVIVGRGAQFILPTDQSLRVRAVAPLEDRVRGVATRQGLDERQARERIVAVEEERRGFVRDFFGRSDEEPAAYDLVVNTATVPLSAAVQMVLEAYHGRFGDLPPRVAGATG